MGYIKNLQNNNTANHFEYFADQFQVRVHFKNSEKES